MLLFPYDYPIISNLVVDKNMAATSAAAENDAVCIKEEANFRLTLRALSFLNRKRTVFHFD